MLLNPTYSFLCSALYNMVCPFVFFCHYIVYPSSIYGSWLALGIFNFSHVSQALLLSNWFKVFILKIENYIYCCCTGIQFTICFLQHTCYLFALSQAINVVMKVVRNWFIIRRIIIVLQKRAENHHCDTKDLKELLTMSRSKRSEQDRKLRHAENGISLTGLLEIQLSRRGWDLINRSDGDPIIKKGLGSH